MARLFPFRALGPRPSEASQIAAVPYDVVSGDEARQLAEGNPLSFLRVSRAELELPPSADPYSEAVYARAAKNFETLTASSFVRDDRPCVYFYAQRMGAHVQVGVAACFSLDEYDRDLIKKHERTRRDKEDDRTRHMLALGAQTGPVFLTYQSSAEVNAIADRVTSTEPLVDFEAPDGVRHTLWRTAPDDQAALVAAFGRVPALYIADGHHRAASAARTRDELRTRRGPGAASDGTAEFETFLAVAFPHDQVQVLPYNRVVKDLAGRSPEQFLDAVRAAFAVESGPASPARRGEIAMYLQGRWSTLRPLVAADASDPVASLDVSVLQDRLLAPVLGIKDVRTDKRIDFVGGARGTAALQAWVDSGKAAVAFSLYPVSVADLMAVSDAGAMMPPKSTWFEPKLRDGLLVHTF